MFSRKGKWIGRIRSDEGFSVRYQHKGVRYSDDRGEVDVAFEDNLLFPESAIWLETRKKLSDAERDLVLGRIQEALIWDGHKVRVWTSSAPR